MVVSAVNPFGNPSGWYGSHARHVKAGRKGRRRHNPLGNPRHRRYARRKRNPIELMQNLGFSDILLAGAGFIAVNKVAELARQTGWMDVGVKALAAVGAGMVAKEVSAGSAKIVAAAAVVPAVLGAWELLRAQVGVPPVARLSSGGSVAAYLPARTQASVSAMGI